MDYNENKIHDDISNEGKEESEEEEFEPLEETDLLDDIFNTFEPREEKDDNRYVFETDFMPKDEPNASRVAKKKLDKEKEKKLNQQPKKIKGKEVSGNKKGKTLQKLYNDGVRKECGRCHEIKPISHFILRRDKTKPYPKSTCKKCDLINKQIYALSNKYKIIQNIYGGKLKGKCQECDTGASMLPAIEFHHLDPNLKKISWHSQMYKNWEKTKEKLEKEKVTLLCRNCHFKQRSKIYNKYEEIIQKKEIGLNTTNKEILHYVKRKITLHHQSHLRNQVILHIKKRNIINQLYGGKCVGCKQITTEENLPTLNFHHRNKSNLDKSNVWNRINHLEFKKIKIELIKKDCVSLCGNCHQLIDSHHFKNHHEKIIGPEYSEQVKTFYDKILKNIRSFKFK